MIVQAHFNSRIQEEVSIPQWTALTILLCSGEQHVVYSIYYMDTLVLPCIERGEAAYEGW